ncbi:hypothetical protein OS21_02670 [Dickeya oryzae]
MGGDGWGVITYQRDIDSLFHDILRLVKKKATENRGKCRICLMMSVAGWTACRARINALYAD